MSTTDTTAEKGGWTPRLALSMLTMVMIMEGTALGYSLVTTALPAITTHFKTDQGGWLLTGFILAGAVLCPLVGKLADIHGKRRMMIVCLMASTVGSVVAAVAPTFGVLIAGRMLQGAVLPTMFLSYSLMRDVYPRRILPLASAIAMTGIGVFSIGVPFLIGWLLDNWGFRGLFAFDVLWMIILTPLLLITTPETRLRVPSKVDFLGAGMLGFGLGILLLGISSGSKWGWGSVATLGAFAVGLLLLFGFVKRSLNFAQPIVDLRIFTRRPIVLAAVTAATAYGSTAITGSMLPMIGMTPGAAGLGYGLGMTASEYAMITAPQSVAMVVMGVVVGKLLSRVGGATMMRIGLLLLLVGGIQLGFNHGSYVQVLIAALLVGAGTGLAYGSVPGLVIAGSPADKQGSIAGMVQVSYSGFASTAPVILFVIMGELAMRTPDGAIRYPEGAINAGGVFLVGLVTLGLLLASTVLRIPKQDAMISQDPDSLLDPPAVTVAAGPDSRR
ncbi:MFS transporter [Streptosporangium sp. NBC_01755]|uniref:MFS transporter n=1 Tax=unclassified Streptosporangium TaxID=2632669 RepID=UPI002DDC0712|nr:MULTISPECIES: MFS transporter [unclassified Streptosporangium]WSA24255.1 MFS transporter [Streptosporangium sp. NBC_01810]WSC97670.1 MFS transporter [Streptosporangium sp. NBC_01755]